MVPICKYALLSVVSLSVMTTPPSERKGPGGIKKALHFQFNPLKIQCILAYVTT